MKKTLLVLALAAVAVSVGALDASASSTRQVNLFCDANYLSVERGTSGIMVRNDSGITIPKGTVITIHFKNGLLGKQQFQTRNEVSYAPINAHGGTQTFTPISAKSCTATATLRLWRHS